MNKFKYLAMMLAAGMFAACSDSLEEVPGGGGDTPTSSVTDGYVKVSISVPTTGGASTRVDDSSDFDDGVESEYAVNDGILVFFTKQTSAAGTPESAATFVKAYNITLSNPSGGNSQVTTRYSYIGEAPMPNEGYQMYALAILNTNGIFSVNADNGALQYKTSSSETVSNVFSEESNTLAQLQTKIATTSDAVTATGFMMLNAPLSKSSTYAGITSLSEVQTLVPVEVYEDEELAQSRPASDIYVERVVAKVTLKGFTYDADGADKYTKSVATDDEDSPFNDDEVALIGWSLNVTNKSTKAVRDVSGLTTWITSAYGTDARFVGTNNIDRNDLYRIYWGIDNNYSGDSYTIADEFNTYTQDAQFSWNTDTSDNTTDTDDDHALYCLENTMDYDNQNQNQTTTVIIKTKYSAFPENTANKYASFFMYGAQQQTYNESDFLTAVRTALSWDTSHNGETLAIATDADGGTYTYATEIPTGQNSIISLFTISGGSATELTTTEAQTLYNALGNIRYYKDGATYYNTVLIRHFDDTNTDVVWNPSTGGAYTQKHLGRYGVLRNNWYEINVTGISGPGAPSIEEPDPDPDDDTEGYIQARINVLSWAKRAQDVEL